MELIDLDDARRQDIEDSIIDKLFSDAEKNRRHKMAMEISVAMRLQHKDKPEMIKCFKDEVAAPTRTPGAGHPERTGSRHVRRPIQRRGARSGAHQGR